MSKKKAPLPRVQRCLGCDEAPPAAGARFCSECATEADQKMGKSYLTGEVAKLVWFAREWGIDVEALVIDALEEKRVRLMTESLASIGIEYVRGKPLPEGLRRALRDAQARRYLQLREGGESDCARKILEEHPDLFESKDDVRQQARRVAIRDKKLKP